MPDYLDGWNGILDVVIGDYQRGEAHLLNTYSFLFANIVAAYESTGLAIGIEAAADHLGVPADIVITGAGTMGGPMEGSDENDIFYREAADQTARGGQGHDAYVFGQGFGTDVIDEVEPPFTNRKDDLIRFADIASTEVTATRQGLDLIIAVNGASDQVTVLRQFEGIQPDLFGNDVSDETGVAEIAFANGVVWDKLDIARQVFHPLPGDETLTGTPTIDFLDGGAGNDTLVGGDAGDVYRFDAGYGQDVIEDHQDNILIEGPDIVEFGAGIALDDLELHREGKSLDLEIRLEGTTDTLTIQDQFYALYTGVFGTEWLYRIEGLVFDDGQIFGWEDVLKKMVADGKTDGDDTIWGFSYEDHLDGGAGDDLLGGGNENDTYVFGLGYGRDTIFESIDTSFNITSGQTDTVEFKDGITSGDVQLSRQADSYDPRMTGSRDCALTMERRGPMPTSRSNFRRGRPTSTSRLASRATTCLMAARRTTTWKAAGAAIPMPSTGTTIRM